MLFCIFALKKVENVFFSLFALLFLSLKFFLFIFFTFLKLSVVDKNVTWWFFFSKNVATRNNENIIPIMHCRLRIMSSHVYQIFKLIRTMTRVSYHWIFDSNVGILTHIASSVLLITGIAMFLSVIFCSTFLFSYYLLSLWRLRRISFMMKKFKGPPMLPLVGNAHLFAGCNGRGRSM